MKKYLIASVVAVMAFAFAAFAASLNVTAPVLQAGETEAGALECAGSATVVAWFYNDFDGSVDGVRVALNEGHTCTADEMLHVTPLKADGTWIDGNTRGQIMLDPSTAYAPNKWIVNSSPGPVDAGLIYGVRIGIDQGHVS
jgi:hypothetical protein